MLLKIFFFPFGFLFFVLFWDKKGEKFFQVDIIGIIGYFAHFGRGCVELIEDTLRYAIYEHFTCCVGSNVLNSLKILYIMLSMKISSCCAGATNQSMFVKFWW